MNFIKLSIATAVASTVFLRPAFAQDVAFQLPEQCIVTSEMGEMDHATMDHSGDMGADRVDLSAFPDHVQENMRKMMMTMPAMEQGMMNEDPDVAFACAMIAHHQGAIDMARVLLGHGDDPEMISLAKEIVDAQVGEIERMTKWLAESVN